MNIGVHLQFHYIQAEKRAHHNALERKRRDHIKDSFYCLRDAVPQLRGEKVGVYLTYVLTYYHIIIYNIITVRNPIPFQLTIRI